MQATQKAHPILLTLLRIQQKHGKDYSWPGQLKICELMDFHHGIRKSRKTLCRWLRVIEDSKYLIRRRRIKRHPEYGMVFKSTLYKITIKGLRLLSRFGVDVSKEIAVYNAWLKAKSPKLNKEPGFMHKLGANHRGLNQILNKLGAKFIT